MKNSTVYIVGEMKANTFAGIYERSSEVDLFILKKRSSGIKLRPSLVWRNFVNKVPKQHLGSAVN